MAFIQKLTDYITKNYDLSNDSLTIIFPNKRAALTLRKELEKRIERNIWLPQILSIQEVMSSWSGLELLDNVDVIYELIKIMNKNVDVSNRKNLFTLAGQIVKDFDEIDQYAVNAEKIFKYLKDIKEIESWSPDDELSKTESAYLFFFKSLFSFYTQLRDILLNDKSAYYGMMTRQLHELSDVELHKAVGNNKIIFAGFNAMTNTEENIIVRLVESGKAVLFWDLDKYYFDDELQEAGLFARHFFSKHPKLKPETVEDYFSNETKHINIIGVAGSAIQANALQLQLYEEQKSEKKLTNEVIVLSDETLLIPVLNSIPENYKDINVTMGYPYSETFLNQFIQLIFTFQKRVGDNESMIYFWSLKRLLETEMVKVIFTHEELESLTECINKFLKDSTYYLSISELEEQFNQRRIIDFIKIITKKWHDPDNCIESLKMLLRFISECAISYSNTFVINQINVALGIFNKIKKLIRKYNILVQIDDVETLYKQTASEMSIKFKNKDSGNNIESNLQIMGLLETRNLDFETVHILSVNEGILPQSKSPNSLLPYDLRREYDLPIYTNKQAVYAYHFYRLIQNAKTVNIYYSTLTDDVGDGEPSRFIRQLINEIPRKTNNIMIKELSYRLPSAKNDEVVKIEVQKTPEIIEKIKNKLYNECCDKKSDCYTIKGLAPTSISCYLKCPLKFYIKYIEKKKDDTPKEDIQANIVGNIIHSTFENFYKEFGQSIIDDKLFNQIETNCLEKSFISALKDNNFANGLPETGFNYLTHIFIKELINNFINNEKKFFEKGNKIIIKGLEENLNHTFNLDDNTKVYLMGFADRIDMVKNKTRILDYKSGKVKDSDVEIISGKDEVKDIKEKALQLCIYKYLYAKNNPDISIENIEPGIFGLLDVNNPYFPLSINSEKFTDENFIETCDKMFINLFKEMLDPEIPFKQTEDEKNCKYCDYIDICKRDSKTW